MEQDVNLSMTENERRNESAPAEPEKCQGESLQHLENRKNTKEKTEKLSGGKAVKINLHTL